MQLKLLIFNIISVIIFVDKYKTNFKFFSFSKTKKYEKIVLKRDLARVQSKAYNRLDSIQYPNQLQTPLKSCFILHRSAHFFDIREFFFFLNTLLNLRFDNESNFSILFRNLILK